MLLVQENNLAFILLPISTIHMSDHVARKCFGMKFKSPNPTGSESPFQQFRNTIPAFCELIKYQFLYKPIFLF